MKSIVSLQDMTEEFSSGKTMTNSEDVATNETSVLVPSPKQNDAKNEGQPMDIGGSKEDEITPTNGSISGDTMEDSSNDVTDENSNTDVNSNVEAAKEEQNGSDAGPSGDNPTVVAGSCKPPGHDMEGANAQVSTKESTNETASESASTNDDTMGSGDGNDDFVNAIEEQLEKVVQEEKAGDLNTTKPEEEEPVDDRPESEKVVSFVMDALFESAMEQITAKAHYDEALSKLNTIAQSNRRLLDEDLPGTTGKRPGTDVGAPVVSKRPKLESGAKKEEPGVKKEENVGDAKKLQKDIRRLTRKELEDLVAASMVEVLSSRSEIGQLRRKCDRYDECIDKWKKKASALQKQCQDLNQVMKKYITDAKSRPNGAFVAPIKITRSVGLQVNNNAAVQTNRVMSDKKRVPPVMGPASRTLQQQQQVQQQQARAAGGPARFAAAAPSANATVRAAVANLPPPMPTTRGVRMQMSGPGYAPAAAAHKPAPASVVRQRVQLPPSTTLTKTSSPPKQQKKSVIDVVDLSDDDEQQPLTRTLNRTSGGSIRVVPQSQLQARSGPGGNRQIGYNAQNRVITTQPGGAIIMSNGQQLIPVNPPPGARVVHQMVTPRLAPAATFQQQHPAPLPAKPGMQMTAPGWKALPPRPALKISKLKTGIVLSWNMELRPFHASVATYQIFAYQEGSAAPTTTLWKKVGDVKALPLPMACTLTQFQRGNKYHFAVRAIDEHKRVGDFCEPQTIALS